MNTVYILKCNDSTLYCGSTVDLKKRFKEHSSSKNGAKYTRARRPVFLVYSENTDTLPQARAREAEIKRMTREKKLRLISDSK